MQRLPYIRNSLNNNSIIRTFQRHGALVRVMKDNSVWVPVTFNGSEKEVFVRSRLMPWEK